MLLTLQRIAFPEGTLPRCVAALAFVGLVALLFVAPQDSTVSANDLLQRATSAEKQTVDSGVLCQKILIRAPSHAFVHSVYRDLCGRRHHPRQKPLASADARLQVKLALAGVSWERPLSALSYKEWHDRQRALRDEIQQTADKFLLTTIVAGGSVARESLTVRGSDFHPVKRIVEFRDEGDVETLR